MKQILYSFSDTGNSISALFLESGTLQYGTQVFLYFLKLSEHWLALFILLATHLLFLFIFLHKISLNILWSFALQELYLWKAAEIKFKC